MRKFVTLRRVDEIREIKNADRIVEARVGGWSVVVKKDEFKPGDIGLFFEIDAALPLDNPLFEFLAERSVKTFENREVHVLKTARLRGVYSQGLLLPFDTTEVATQFAKAGLDPNAVTVNVVDYAKVFDVKKYEPPLALNSKVIGNFPYEAQKTDSERVQNIPEEVFAGFVSDDWYATEKIDGTSSTFVKRNDELITASRSWELSQDSLQGQFAQRHNLAEIMPEGAVIQGELAGEKIEKNPLKLEGKQLFVFSYTLGDDKNDPKNEQFLRFVKEHHVPFLDLKLPETVEAAVAQVEGMKSAVSPKAQAEGVVWWNAKGTRFDVIGHRPNFKVINNKFLLKHDR